jgi:hypothetical protein
MRLARRTFRPLLAATVTGVLVATLMPASPAAAKTVKIDNRLFGMHDSNPSAGSWPAARIGSMRLWDASLSWPDIETSPGVYDFRRLDQVVAEAHAHRTELTLVLGLTPTFYQPAGGSIASVPTDLNAWNNYVLALVNRYSAAHWGYRGIAAYQVWNEANVKNYWTGSPAQMAQLTRITYAAVKGADRGALVIGPAFANRIAEQTRGIGFFYYYRFPDNRTPVWRYMDAISLNLYPKAYYGSKPGTPEKSMQLLAAARSQLRLRGVPDSKPIWNTEINYGLETGGSGASSAIGGQRQAAYVLRTYLLNAANGIKRVHWYAWDKPSLGNTKMSFASTGGTTLAGKAFGLARSWLSGGTLIGASTSATPCAKNSAGTYTCVIKYAKGVRRVYWNPTKKVKVTTVKSATFKMGVYGKKATIKGGSRQTVDYRPLMVRSKR